MFEMLQHSTSEKYLTNCSFGCGWSALGIAAASFPRHGVGRYSGKPGRSSAIYGGTEETPKKERKTVFNWRPRS